MGVHCDRSNGKGSLRWGNGKHPDDVAPHTAGKCNQVNLAHLCWLCSGVMLNLKSDQSFSVILYTPPYDTLMPWRIIRVETEQNYTTTGKLPLAKRFRCKLKTLHVCPDCTLKSRPQPSNNKASHCLQTDSLGLHWLVIAHRKQK